MQVDPLADRPQPGALLEEYQALLLAEKDCMQVRWGFLGVGCRVPEGGMYCLGEPSSPCLGQGIWLLK